MNPNDGVDIEKIVVYRENIMNKLRGKFGMFSLGSTYLGFGTQSKEFSTGFIPTNTVVVVSDKFWKDLWRKDPRFKDISYEDFIKRLALPEGHEDSIDIYGTPQRYPFIWFFQGLNVAQIWHPRRADLHMRSVYNIGFFEKYPYFKRSGVQALVRNVVDSVMFNQSDSDGDMGMLLVPISIQAQEVLHQVYTQMYDYGILRNDKYTNISKIWHHTRWALISQFMKEIEGNTSHGYASKLRCDTGIVKWEEANKAYFNAIRAKQSIGFITVSQWMIQQIAGYLLKNDQISIDEYIGVCSFYQLEITQNGCIRSVKHVSGALNVLTLDEIAKNTKAIVENGKDITPLEKILDLMDMTGYKHCQDAFRKIVEFWINNAMVIDGKIDSSKCTSLGNCIKFSVAFIYGSTAGISYGQDFFAACNTKFIQQMPIYDQFGGIIDMINSIPDNYLDYIHKYSEE